MNRNHNFRISAQAIIFSLALVMATPDAQAAAGDYNADDIALINLMRTHNGLNWPAAATNGDVTAAWMTANWPGVYWTSDATNKRIRGLDVSNKALHGQLGVSGLTQLDGLWCHNNNLSAIYLGGCANLVALSCQNNVLKSLNVSNLPILEELSCYNNDLTSIDLSGNPNLLIFDCTNNALESLNVSACANMTEMSCKNNYLTSLALNASAYYQYLDVSYNRLPSKSAVTGKTIIWDESNTIFSPQKEPTYNPGDIAVINNIIANNGLNWTPCTDPSGYSAPGWPTMGGVTWSSDATNKRITHLMIVSQSPKLTGTLDVGGLTNLSELFCHGNSLSALNVGGLTNLRNLWCYNNSLSALDVGGLTNLSELYCNNNSLSALDLSGLTSLQRLECFSNSLSDLDVGGLTNLTYLYCNNNSLSALDLSGLTNLRRLYCNNNLLTSLALNASAPYELINVSRNNMTSENAVTGKVIPWGTVNFVYSPQNVPQGSTYAVTVNSGTGSGNYAAGETVSITANAAPAGKTFDRWTTSDGVTFANATAPATSFTMPAKAVTVTATYKDLPPTTYAVTVNSGTGGGNYAAGGTVSITANAAPAGKTFDRWTTTDGVAFANATAPATSFTMPAKAVTVTATYKDLPTTTYAVTVNSGSGGGNYAAGETVSITANAAPAGKTFDRWTTSDGVTFANATAPATSFTMPAKAVTVTATYHDPTGIEEIGETGELKAWVYEGVLHVSGLTAGQLWRVYNLMGTLVYQGVASSDKAEMSLSVRGVYVVADGKATVKVVN